MGASGKATSGAPDGSMARTKKDGSRRHNRTPQPTISRTSWVIPVTPPPPGRS